MAESLNPSPTNVIPPNPQADSTAEFLENVLENVIPTRKLLKLYFPHTFTATSDRSVEFCTVLILSVVYNDLLQIGILTFVNTSVTILLSPSIARWLMKRDSFMWPHSKLEYWRLNKIQITMLLMKLSILVMYACLVPLVLNLGPQTLLFVLVCIFSSILRLMFTANTLAIERDWVVLMTKANSSQLTSMNATMRRIDLIVQILAPLIIGLLGAATISGYSHAVGASLVQAIFVLVWTAVTSPAEWMFLQSVYVDTPDLWSEGWEEQEANLVVSLMKDIGIYFRHPLLLCSLSMALLYLTVVSFDGILITYLKWAGFSDIVLAAVRGVAVLSGLMGTVIMPWLCSRIGLERTGMWSISFEFACLVMVLVSFFVGTTVEGSIPLSSALLLFIGVILSRAGLWSFDLTQVQILQTRLEPTSRESSVVNGIQTSFCNVFQLLSSVVVIIISNPVNFVWGVVVSVGSVGVAVLLFILWSWRTRGHLIHPEKIPILRKLVQD